MVTQLPGIILLGSGKRKKTKTRKLAEKSLVPLLATAGLLGGILLAPAIVPAIAGIGARQLLKKGAVTIGRGALRRTPKTTLGAVKLVAGAGLVTGLGVSGVTKVTKKVFKSGRKAGEILLDPSKAQDVLGIRKSDTAKEKIVKGLVGAGLVGGAVVLGKEIIKRRKEKALIPKPAPVTALIPTPALRQLGFTEPRPVGLGGVPSPLRAPVGAPGVPAQTLAKSPGTIIQISI